MTRTAAHGSVDRFLSVALVLLTYYGIQSLTGTLALHPRLDLPGEVGRGSWVQDFDHHFWQLAMALALIGLLGGGQWAAWGLNLRNRRESFRLLRRFLVIYGGYFIGVGFVIQLLFLPPPSVGPMTPTHVAGRLAFGFLFVGVSEEILFRGLYHTYLARSWTGSVRWLGWDIPTAGVIATLVFTLAHVGISLDPLTIYHLYWPQLIMAFVLGLFYSVAYDRTGSLLAPILAHNFSDGALWASEYLLAWLKG